MEKSELLASSRSCSVAWHPIQIAHYGIFEVFVTSFSMEFRAVSTFFKNPFLPPYPSLRTISSDNVMDLCLSSDPSYD